MVTVARLLLEDLLSRAIGDEGLQEQDSWETLRARNGRAGVSLYRSAGSTLLPAEWYDSQTTGLGRFAIRARHGGV